MPRFGKALLSWPLEYSYHLCWFYVHTATRGMDEERYMKSFKYLWELAFVLLTDYSI